MINLIKKIKEYSKEDQVMRRLFDDEDVLIEKKCVVCKKFNFN